MREATFCTRTCVGGYGTSLQVMFVVLQPYDAATPAATCSSRARRRSKVGVFNARMVPCSSTLSGMTLAAPGPVLKLREGAGRWQHMKEQWMVRPWGNVPSSQPLQVRCARMGGPS